VEGSEEEGEDDVSEVVERLLTNESGLVKLNLFENLLGEEGGRAIGQALSRLLTVHQHLCWLLFSDWGRGLGLGLGG
jgi:Ran GTPase-activating protein (RanGAP) involved in mRNA processing and transport